jgi:phosphatidylserine/phosphatidylglycerophosphate/cardiolipin synthase-like enzyme
MKSKKTPSSEAEAEHKPERKVSSKKDAPKKDVVARTILQYVAIVAGIIALVFGIKYAINRFVPSLPIYNPTLPAETVRVDKPLDAKVYFNNVLGQTTFLDNVVQLIDQSQKTLEIAVFSMDSPKVIDAIYRANDRGVQVTLVLDLSREDKHNQVLAKMPQSIKRIDVGTYNRDISYKTTYMHHKFLLADRSAPNAKLLMGSMDFTTKGEMYEQSFYVITPDETLIKYYGSIFDLLKQGTFGDAKFENQTYNPWLAEIGYTDSYVSLWSSPGYKRQSVRYKILDLIKGAKSSINIMMWELNDKEIANALVSQANKGVKVTIIADDLRASDQDSAIPFLQSKVNENKSGNLQIILDTKSKKMIDLSKFGPDFNPFIHHHSMIVDDATLEFGSNNWTEWGFTKNDEDTIITNNKYLIGEFGKTFNYFLTTLK